MQPDGWGEWGGAGIVMNLNPPVSGADRGHDQGAATPPPDNGADRQCHRPCYLVGYFSDYC